jgi:hypothetical protein
VLRLRLAGARGRASVADFHLFEGTLSSYYVRRLAARDEPDTLREREVDVLSWNDGRDVVVAPTSALTSGVYSLATPALGLIAEVTVDPALVPWLERRWPPADAALGSGFSVFCGDGASGAEPGPVVLAPAGVGAELSLGVGDDALFADECVSLAPSATTSRAPELPPALAGAVALEPLPLVPNDDGVASPACDGDERAFGPACGTIDDDRIVLRARDDASLWVVEEPEALLGVAASGASLVVHGFEPGAPVRLRATAFDLSGERTSVDEVVVGAAAHAHVVLNEVLANPSGPESAGEWVELVNDGAAAVELAGFEFRDSGAAVSLPDAVIEPGQFVLLAADGFAPDPELDVPLVIGTRVITLPKLGQSGLANGGELLRLFDASGRLLSRFPAIAAPDAGVSVARRTPDAPDDDASAFGAHAPPGASPGAANELAEP